MVLAIKPLIVAVSLLTTIVIPLPGVNPDVSYSTTKNAAPELELQNTVADVSVVDKVPSPIEGVQLGAAPIPNE